MTTSWTIDRSSPPAVVIEGAATEPMRFGQGELERYVEAMLSAKPASGRKKIVLARGRTGELGEEGYVVEVKGGNLRITGGGDRGVVFGVYGFLRDHCGCVFAGMGPDGEHVPQCETIEVKATGKVCKPNIPYRAIQFSSVEHAEQYRRQIDWMAKNGLNTAMVMFSPEDEGVGMSDVDPVTGVHVRDDGNKYRITETWYDRHLGPELRKRGMITQCDHHNLRFWLSPGTYFKKHPEWYAQIDGVRGKSFSQMCICTSNEEAVSTLIENFRGFLRRRPEIRHVGVIPEDGHGMCQCAACVKDDVNPRDAFTTGRNHRSPDGENRSLMNRYAKLLNRVKIATRDEFPDVELGGAAYVDLQWPPRDVQLEPGISFWLALYWRDGARPMTPGRTSSRNELFIDLVRQWKQALRGPLYVYEYYMGMNAQRSLPYPMSKVIVEDWPALRELGVTGTNIQMIPSCHEAYGLNLAAFARSAWSAKVDHDQVMDDYLLGMFGHAGKALRPVFQGLVDALDELAKDANVILQPDGENVRYFMDKIGPDGPRKALAAARKLATTERETRQLDRFAQYVRYLELANENNHPVVIDYLATVDAPGWFAPSARKRWISNFAREKAAKAAAV